MLRRGLLESAHFNMFNKKLHLYKIYVFYYADGHPGFTVNRMESKNLYKGSREIACIQARSQHEALAKYLHNSRQEWE